MSFITKFIQSDEYLSKTLEFLDKLDIDGSKIVEIITNNNAIIAGSCPLQILLGETYENSDIDIFVKINVLSGIDLKSQPIFKDIDENFTVGEIKYKNNKKINYETRDINHETNKINYETSDINYETNKVHSTAYVSINDKVILNFVFTKNDPVEFVVKKFDMSQCQTFFDGKIMYFHEETLEKKGLAFKVSENFNKYLKENLRDRIVKYQQRNFTIIEDDQN